MEFIRQPQTAANGELNGFRIGVRRMGDFIQPTFSGKSAFLADL